MDGNQIGRNIFIIAIFSIACLMYYHTSLTIHINSITSLMYPNFKQNEIETDKFFEFYRIHEQMIKENSSSKKISFNGYTAGGYGNKLYSFLSSLIIALITDSQIVLRWKDIDKYVNPPINIFDSVPEDEDLNEAEFKSKSYYFGTKQSWNLNKNVGELMKTSVPNGYLRYFYSSINPFFMEICTNPEFFEKFQHYNLVSNETVNSALKTISNTNSTEKEKQEKLFRVGFEVGGNLLNKVWIPNTNITQEIANYVEKEFKNHYVIGLQLRYGDGNPNQIYLDEKNDTNKFINCALNIEKEYLLKNSQHKSSLFKWFIASDSAANTKEIFTKYPGKAFTTNGTLSHVAYDANGYHRTILDVELLSLCNEIIITGGSTFGWVSAMKKLKLPLYINGFSSMSECLRAEFSQAPKTPSGYAVFRSISLIK